MTRDKVLVLAALKPELAPLRRRLDLRPDVRLVKTGVGPQRAGEAARRALAQGASLVVTTGCCGGLVPGASQGMMVVPSKLLRLERGQVQPAPDPDPHWGELARQVADRLGHHCSARPLITVEQALSMPADKQRCHQLSDAVAVDMETAAIAREAERAGVPHLVLRVVLDAVDEVLPETTVSDAQGRVRPLRVARAMLRPRSFVSLAAMALRLRSIAEALAALVEQLLAEA